MKNGFQRKHFSGFSSRNVPKIDAVIDRFFAGKLRGAGDVASILYSDLREYCLRDGKRIRPLLLLMGYLGYGKGGRLKEIIRIASALELMHSFLLIQDDIIDRSRLRRGRKTLHILAGERFRSFTRNQHVGTDVAIVMADILMTGSLELISGAAIDPALKNRFLPLFAETYERTAYGQILDIIHARPRKVDDFEVPGEIGASKTAYYTMVFPLLMGYMLAGGADRHEERLIRDFALPLGLAFQVRDDILGTFGGPGDSGKSSDSDLREGKLTFMAAHALKALGSRQGKRFLDLLSLETKSPGDIKSLRKTMLDTGALESSRQKLAKLSSGARKALPALGVADAIRNALADLVEMVDSI